MSARELLRFRTVRRAFAVDAGAVREILPAAPPTRIPGRRGAVRRLVNVRGALVTVVDAALAWRGGRPGVGGSGNGGAGPALVPVEHRSGPIGLIADDVLDLVTVGDAALTAGGAFPRVRPEVVAATDVAGGERFAPLATDVLPEPWLA